MYDARLGRRPAVSWFAPSAGLSEHPSHSIAKGMAYVTGLVNSVMEDSDWNTTAIFVGYDEWGGRDHVVLPSVDGEGLGLRVPGLVISSYARKRYVDYRVYSAASWLKTIEERFDLPPLADATSMLSTLISLLTTRRGGNWRRR